MSPKNEEGEGFEIEHESKPEKMSFKVEIQDVGGSAPQGVNKMMSNFG
jgi:hypothetical protein